MRSEVVILALVAILAVVGLVMSGNSAQTGAATNPGIACKGYWTYVYGVNDGGGLQCVETKQAPSGGSYSGGGEGMGSWAEPHTLRKQGPTRGFTQQELQQLKEKAKRDTGYQ